MFEHQDVLSKLNDHIPLKEKLVYAHHVVQEKFPFIARIAVTVYDPDTKVLKTFLHSSGDDDPLFHYQALLDEATSLKDILRQGKPRVVNNLVTFEHGTQEHTNRIGRQGYAASYTMPMFYSGEFFGFLFFNSYEKEVFTEKVLTDLDVYGHLISLMIVNELYMLRVMTAAVSTTSQFTHVRDPETGSHLDRMSRYSRLIALALADKYDLNDEYIEHVFMFAPLHDIGKVAIPDSVLLKPGKLNSAETVLMHSHAEKGREMIDTMIANFGLGNINHINVLRNIAQYHHEAVNGTGYPDGKCGSDIPLEARIVAVADVFDALTTQRPYKEAWSNSQALDMLRKMAGQQLDQDCVQALLDNMSQVEGIQSQFQENQFG
ncbi:MAG: HD domain-containing protein [Gammaproteobacteria bacterium]|nr:HD domain-containing protein [Gammaproteobacteria bacterium]MDH5800933.1 HD domain-containing protein [Gammaproteobacteria bacterium]